MGSDPEFAAMSQRFVDFSWKGRRYHASWRSARRLWCQCIAFPAFETMSSSSQEKHCCRMCCIIQAQRKTSRWVHRR